MLRKIAFFIADRQQIEAVEKMKRNMGSNGIIIDIYGPVPDGGDRAKDITGLNLFDTGVYGKDSTLFVTDTKVLLQELKNRGNYVIVLFHENNKEEDLSGAAYGITDIEELTFDSFEKVYRRLAGMPWTIMETDRCMIREMTVEDVEDFYRIYSEPSITYYMDDLYEDPENEREYTREYIRKIYGFYGYGLWSIINKEDGNVMGRAGLSWREGFDIPEIGFVIAVPYQRRGYAYEVCSAIVRYGMEELEFDKIQALVKKGNEASINLCMKLGFVRMDEVEDKGTRYERYVLRG